MVDGCKEHAISMATNPRGYEFFRYKIEEASKQYYPNQSIVFLQGEYKGMPVIFGCWTKNDTNEITGERIYNGGERDYEINKGNNWKSYKLMD